MTNATPSITLSGALYLLLQKEYLGNTTCQVRPENLHCMTLTSYLKDSPKLSLPALKTTKQQNYGMTGQISIPARECTSGTITIHHSRIQGSNKTITWKIQWENDRKFTILLGRTMYMIGFQPEFLRQIITTNPMWQGKNPQDLNYNPRYCSKIPVRRKDTP